MMEPGRCVGWNLLSWLHPPTLLISHILTDLMAAYREEAWPIPRLPSPTNWEEMEDRTARLLLNRRPHAPRPPSCPVGSRRSTLGRNGDSGKCVSVRCSLSRPCLSREREVCVAVCVLCCRQSKQEAPNGSEARGSPPFIPCVSLCLSTSVSLQMVLCFPPF